MKKIFFLLVFSLSNFIFAQSPMTLLANWDDNTLPVKSDISYNDCWGYAAANNREYAILGSLEKVFFFEVTSTATMSAPIAAFVPGANSIWRDFKTYSHYAYAVADQGTEGLLVFDLANINGTSSRVTQIFQDNTTFSRCHNIYIDEPNRKLYCAGSNTVNGLTVFDLDATTGIPTLCAQIPLNINGFTSGYIHDNFVRNGKIYCSHGTNGLRIYDVSGINAWQVGNPVITTMLLLGTNNMVNSGYNHSSWLNSAGTHLIMAEETHGKPLKVLDVSAPTAIGNFSSPTGTIQSCMLCPSATTPIVHNPFVKGNLVFLSYYHEGIQVYDISNPALPTKVAFYDTEPSNTNYNGYAGAWGTYPFLPSQKVLGSDVNNGLFVLQLPAALLPATLLDFKATPKKDAVHLFWKTGAESENMTFEVEKSKNGLYFEGFSAWKSKNRNGASYACEDENPNNGQNYYRLKQIEKDGRFEYSKIIEVNFDIFQNAKIYPNPSENGTINIDFEEKINWEDISVEIIDLQGRIIFTATKNINPHLVISNLQKGFYIAKIKIDGQLQVEKFSVD
jgi:choice-of-anchor B domain-containing protein